MGKRRYRYTASRLEGIEVSLAQAFKGNSGVKRTEFLRMLSLLVANAPEVYDTMSIIKKETDTLKFWGIKRGVEALQLIDYFKGDRRIRDLDSLIENLEDVIDSIYEVLEEFHREFVDRSHKPGADSLQRGSLGYLMIESHSVSRRKLHQEVEEFLTRQLLA